MARKVIFFFITIFFLSKFNFVFADVVINEVQLLPTESRFIELYNTGDSAVDLTNWLMQRKTATSETFGSLVSSPNFQGKTIDAHGYFLISRQQLTGSDIVVENLTLTESNTIQIKISGASGIIDKIGWGSSADCINPCPANPALGKSLVRTQSGSWTTDSPTPKAANQNIAAPDSSFEPNKEDVGVDAGSVSPGIGENSSRNASENKNKIIETPKIKTQITAKNVVFANTPVLFQADTLGYSKEPLYYGKYYWNFGDGDSKEAQASNSEKISHTYFYPGDYAVSLEYYANQYSDIPDASDKISIKVVEAGVSISKVGEVQDFFVELTNNTNYDADISNWILSGKERIFSFPKNTILNSKKKITISSSLTHFVYDDKDVLKLLTPQGKVMFDYGASLVSSVPVQIPILPKRAAISAPLPAVQPLEEEVSSAIDNQTSVENLDASAISSGISGENLFSFPAIAAFLFIGASGSAVYFIRKRKSILGAGDDFKILEE